MSSFILIQYSFSLLQEFIHRSTGVQTSFYKNLLILLQEFLHHSTGVHSSLYRNSLILLQEFIHRSTGVHSSFYRNSFILLKELILLLSRNSFILLQIFIDYFFVFFICTIHFFGFSKFFLKKDNYM